MISNVDFNFNIYIRYYNVLFAYYNLPCLLPNLPIQLFNIEYFPCVCVPVLSVCGPVFDLEKRERAILGGFYALCIVHFFQKCIPILYCIVKIYIVFKIC
jgi:hypothetical protein